MSIMDDIFDIEDFIEKDEEIKKSFNNILSWATRMEEEIEKMKGKYCPCCGQEIKK